MYFAIYQAIAKDERRPGLYREFAPDFFDIVIIDECHRGSARDESNWREILEYHTPDFETRLALRPRTEAIAKHLTRFLRGTNPYDKTIVFCVDQEHADAMRSILNNLNRDLAAKHSDYVCRVTADEGSTGKTHLSDFQDLDAEGKQLRVTEFHDYAGDVIRSLFADVAEFRHGWSDPERRREIRSKLDEKQIDPEAVRETVGKPEADLFDLLCHLAWNRPLVTRKERADKLRVEKTGFFDEYGPEARVILDELLDKYAEHGSSQFDIPDVLKIPPISNHGNVSEIIDRFGGAEKLKDAVDRMQQLI